MSDETKDAPSEVLAWISQGGDVSRSAEYFREMGFAEPYTPLAALPATVPSGAGAWTEASGRAWSRIRTAMRDAVAVGRESARYEDESARLDALAAKCADDVQAMLTHPAPARGVTVLPSEALFGFMGWLTSREAVSGPFSAAQNATQAADLVAEFCKSQGWEFPRDSFPKMLTNYPVAALTPDAP